MNSLVALYLIISLCCVGGHLLLPLPAFEGVDPDIWLDLKPLLGGDDHDLRPHYKQLLGKYDHDRKPRHQVNEESPLGGDDHDLRPHHKPLLGEDDHDKKPHHKALLGGDDHDLKSHHKPFLGVDGHDRKPHHKTPLGGDDHDLKPHRKPFGRGDHDLKPHHKPLGEGDHDLKPHHKPLLGEGDHDLKPHHKPLLGKGDHDLKPHHKPLGEGDHDLKPHHKPLLGEGDHDLKPHHKPLLGRGDHDLKPHHKPLGGGDHGFKPRHKTILGQDDHDLKPHHKPLIGRDDHDFKPHHKKLLGADDHDRKPHYQTFGKKPSLSRHMEAFKYFGDVFNRTYTSHAHYTKRFRIFRNNLRKISALQLNEMGTAQYGLTKFADWSLFEFRRLLGLNAHLKPAVSHMKKALIPDIEVPVKFDWRKKGVVTEVKNQGMCGSCWAFSVTGNVEGQWALKHKKLFSLSEQELVDCDDADDGCNGGLPENAYKAIQDLGGLETEKAYPYEGEDDKCQFDPQKVKVQVNGSVELPEDEHSMKKWLVQNGPISIGINANALQFYVGGVSHPFKFLCNPENLDHGMLIVGYGVHTTRYLHRKQPYWLVKNSWGEDWGEKGYYRVYRGDGTCGVNKMATSAIVP